MASIDRVSVKAEAVGTLDCDIKNFADAIFSRLENNNFVGSGAAHQTRGICFAWALTQNFGASSDQFFIRAAGPSVDHTQQVLVARLFCCLVDLIRHGRGGRFAPWGIAKDESIIELELLD